MDANKREEDGRLIAELSPFNEPLEKITPDDLRKFIKPYGVTSINPEDPNNLPVVLDILRLDEQYANRLKSIMQGGVPHQVLECAQAYRRKPDHRGRGRVWRGDDCHQHGWPWCGYQTRRRTCRRSASRRSIVFCEKPAMQIRLT